MRIKNNKIEDISYLSYGCMAAIAACESFCRLAKGKSLKDAKKISYVDIKKNLKDIPEFKLHCSMMVVETFKKAVRDYEKNK